jgi:hypothetical protein
VALTGEDRVRDVIGNFHADGFGSLYPKYKGSHPPKFTPLQRREIKKIAKSKASKPWRAGTPAAMARGGHSRPTGPGRHSPALQWSRISDYR